MNTSFFFFRNHHKPFKAQWLHVNAPPARTLRNIILFHRGIYGSLMIFRIKILYSYVVGCGACGLADKDSGSRFLKNVGIHLRNDTESHHGKPY